MKKLCDLHTHSTYSDGTYAPSEIIDNAVEIGLSAVALCDHNTVDGIPSFLNAAKDKDICAVAGAEFSVDYDGIELHILGLFIPPEYLSQVSNLMLEENIRKEKSNIDLIDSLSKDGIFLSYDEIKSAVSAKRINRAHIAAALTKKGYTSSINEAFKTVLSPEAGYYKEPKKITAFEILDFLISIKTVPILAHPFLNLTQNELLNFLPETKKHGLVGMECKYSSYDALTEKNSLLIADQFNLKYSGGSDFHGLTKPDISIGVGKGNLQIPYEWCLALKDN